MTIEHANTKLISIDPPSIELIDDLRQMIEKTHCSIAATVNSSLTHLYWRIGTRISKEILHKKRAQYGENIVVTLSQQLSWSHFVVLIPIKSAEMCRVEHWSVRTLRAKIDSMLFERTALSKKPDDIARYEVDALRAENRITPNLVFKDPYVLEFLELEDHFLEKDLEDAIMRELERFLLELGGGFCFLSRQKRIIVDNEDYYLDLLFYHRDLNRLIAIDLKLGDFKPEYKGQMELYLRWLDKHEKRPGEKPPIGIILCAGKRQECIELLELGLSGIHVAEYITTLPSKELLREKLQKAVESARKRLENVL